MKKADVETFFARLKAERPEPRTELVYSSPFELLDLLRKSFFDRHPVQNPSN